MFICLYVFTGRGARQADLTDKSKRYFGSGAKDSWYLVVNYERQS